MELTSSKLRMEYIKIVYFHPAYLNYMQSTSYKMLGWMNHKLPSRLKVEKSKLVAQSCLTLYDPMDRVACLSPLSMEFSKQEY